MFETVTNSFLSDAPLLIDIALFFVVYFLIVLPVVLSIRKRREKNKPIVTQEHYEAFAGELRK